jgi:hypothetical protein
MNGRSAIAATSPKPPWPCSTDRRGDGAAGPDRVIVQPAEPLHGRELHHQPGRHPGATAGAWIVIDPDMECGQESV